MEQAEWGRDTAQRDVNAFLSVTATMLVILILELIWGAQWRWLATTALVGVAVALAVPLSGIAARRAVMPNPLLKPPADLDAPVVPPVRLPMGGVDPAWDPSNDLAPPPEYFVQRTPAPAPEPPKPYSPVAAPEGDAPTRQFPRDTGST